MSILQWLDLCTGKFKMTWNGKSWLDCRKMIFTWSIWKYVYIKSYLPKKKKIRQNLNTLARFLYNVIHILLFTSLALQAYTRQHSILIWQWQKIAISWITQSKIRFSIKLHVALNYENKISHKMTEFVQTQVYVTFVAHSRFSRDICSWNTPKSIRIHF